MRNSSRTTSNTKEYAQNTVRARYPLKKEEGHESAQSALLLFFSLAFFFGPSVPAIALGKILESYPVFQERFVSSVLPTQPSQRPLLSSPIHSFS